MQRRSVRSLTTNTLLAFAFALSLAAVPCTAQETRAPSDVVELRNGDRLTGTVSAITSEKVVFQSGALGADPVSIAMADVASITTTSTVRIETADREVLDVVVAGIDGDKLRVGRAGAARDIAIATLVDVRPPVQWVGSVNVGAMLSTGNTERRSVSAGAEATRRSEIDRIRLRGTWDYAEEKSGGGDWNLTQRRLFGEAKYDYFLSDRMYALAQLSGENDEIADLQLRLTAGAGVGYLWADSDDLTWSTEAGLSYVDENRGGGADSNYVAARIASSLRWLLATDTTLLQDTEIFPSLEDQNDFYARLDTRLRTTLMGDLFAQLQWIFDYDNTPAPGRERQDHRLLLSIGWTF
ncbi:MAG: DUF481 domain-containing protein [Planctomycetes bacterium]|nr:DUF481 domain-containing protein [Planctomycetota bacterium]